jgi:hypothetical protein
MIKDEPPTSKPQPATCCHCPLGTREATAASGKSTGIDRVTHVPLAAARTAAVTRTVDWSAPMDAGYERSHIRHMKPVV